MCRCKRNPEVFGVGCIFEERNIKAFGRMEGGRAGCRRIEKKGKLEEDQPGG